MCPPGTDEDLKLSLSLNERQELTSSRVDPLNSVIYFFSFISTLLDFTSSSAVFLPASLHIPQHMSTFRIPLPALMRAVSSYNVEGQRIFVLALRTDHCLYFFPQVVRFFQNRTSSL